MTYLPAPYETPAQDDLAATLAAVLTTTVADLTAWTLGSWSYRTGRSLYDTLAGTGTPNPTPAQMQSALVAAGWAVGALLLGLGALFVLFRRGRKAAVLGGLIAAGTTALAQFGFGFGDTGAPAGKDEDRTAHAAFRCAKPASWRIMLSATIVSTRSR